MLKPGGLFFLGGTVRYAKPPLTVEQQVSRLLQRGLVCGDRDRLERYLSNIGYYRLSAYWLVFELPSNGSTRNHSFRRGTTFDQILEVYVFDRKLRLLVLDALERVEIAVRAGFSNGFVLNFGCHAYLDVAHFRDSKTHEQGMAEIERALKKSRETFVEHYRHKYNDPPLPPIWAVVETLSLGQLSRWLENTVSTDVKRQLSKNLGMPNIDTMQSVLHVLTPVRNDCAHHSRLWNRRYPMKLPTIKKLDGRFSGGNHGSYLFNYLVIIEYLLKQISPSTHWAARAVELFATIAPERLRAMGFPNDWESREPWKGACHG